MADNFTGFRDLGALIGGGGSSAAGSDAYLDGLKGGYDAQRSGFERDKSREEARRARAMAIAREAIPDAAKALYEDPRLAGMAAALFGAANTPSVNQMGKLQVPTALPAFEAAVEAAGREDTTEQNRQTALATGKEFEPFSIAGGGDVLLNAGTGENELTDLGAAELLATEARSDATRLRAEHAVASDGRRGAGSGKPPTTASAEADVLAQARAAIADGADPEAVRQRLRERGYSNLAGKL